ncbi:hypothetical protein [Sphingosinicella soli]|uniref:GNAT family N-acetyltransferase n=1 Tax=Sphingosinicella soli TaxID=333708 RepID=A0A7W7AYE7_9SPHN|nr:hypothetical protein [Sphingosinicella soli]MBB4630670.1 hypothetical protein [Sphingosinicella soli]
MALGETWRALGTATTLSYAIGRAAARIPGVSWHRYRLIAVPLSGMPEMPRGHAVRELSADALKTLVIDAPLQVQADRFARGLICLGAFDGEALVGVNWLARGQYDEDEVNVRFLIPDDAAWDTGLWIREDRRLGRAFAALWAGTGAWLAERGLTRSLSRIADYNLGSLRPHERMGSATLGMLAAARFGAWQIAAGARPALARTGTPAVCDLRGR